VARALLNQPKLIVADEPTTGLDPQARHLIWQRLRQLKSEGATLILTTQYMEEAQQLCDRIVVMYQGKILKEGVPSKLVADEIGREVVEVRVPKEEDDRVVAQLSEFASGHERVGDPLYFCRDGQDSGSSSSSTSQLPDLSRHLRRLPEADQDRSMNLYQVYYIFPTSTKRFIVPTFLVSLIEPLFYLVTFGIGMRLHRLLRREVHLYFLSSGSRLVRHADSSFECLCRLLSR
jgi:ABC-type multidrug transport system ATPase subunit